jgi:hypothetical protein
MPKSMCSMLVAGLAALLVMVTQPAGAFSYECRGDAAKCPAPICSGDQTACEVLQARQDGVDHDTGAHILFTFAVPAGTPTANHGTGADTRGGAERLQQWLGTRS